MRRLLPSIAWTLFAVLGCAVVFAGWLYTQRTHLNEQNRKEIAHAGRDLTVLFRTVSETVDKGLPRNEDELLKLKGELPLVEFAQRNPYVVWTGGNPAVKMNPEPSCRDKNSGFLSPDRIASPRFLYKEEILQIDTSPVANFSDIPVSGAAFEYLLIADSRGKVRVQLEHGAGNALRGQSGWVERQAWEKNDSSRNYPLTQLTDLAALVSPESPQKAQQMLAAASGVIPIKLGDRDFSLFYHPIRVPGLRIKDGKSCETEEVIWIVAGLADPDRMLREALLISPQTTLLLFLLLAVAVAAQPWLKLLLITPTERFRFADACLLIPSAAVSLLVLALLLGSAGNHRYLAGLASNGLEATAGRVEQQMVRELTALRDQLDWYDRAAWERLERSPGMLCSQLTDQTHLYSPAATAPEERWAPTPIPDRIGFSQVSWVGSDGKQFLKATIHDNALRQDVSRRPYFLEPAAGRLWPFAGGPAVFLQSFRSFSTGGVFASVSLRSRLTAKCGQPVVAVVSTEPLLVEDPLLPAGYGFAVITADGRIVFHSDKRRMLKGDFYEEISDPDSLEALLLAKSSGHFKTDYLRRRHEMYITPFQAIPQAGWNILAFRDMQVLSTVGSEALARAAVLSSIPLSFSLLVGLALRIGGKRRLAHFWPAENRAPLYRELVLIYLGLLLLSLLILGTIPAAIPVAFWLAFPLIPLATTIAWCWHRNALVQVPGPPLCLTRPYVGAAALLWLLMSLVPGLGLARYSTQLEMRKIDAFETRRAERHIRDWKARDAEKTRALRVDQRDDYLQARARGLSAFRNTALAESKSRIELLAIVDRYLPVYNETSAWLRHQGEGAGPGARPQEFAGYRDAERAMVWPGLLGGAGLAALIGLVCAFVRYAVRSLFFEEAAAVLKRDAAQDALNRHQRILFLVRSEREQIHMLKLIGRAWRGQAAAAGQPAAGNSHVAAEPGAAVVKLANGIIVPDLERALLQQGALETLEQAWRAGQPIVVLSRALPRDLLPLGTDTYVGERVTERLSTSLPVSKELDSMRWRAVLDNMTFSVADATEAGTEELHGPPPQSETSNAGALPGAWQPPETLHAWFGALWDYCSREERLTLVHVAEEGLANPHQHETVGRLMSKGLLTLRPHLSLMSQDFERFLKRSAVVLQVRKWETAEAGLGWRGSRWIFLLILLIGAAFIAATQEALVKAAAGIIVTLAGVLKGAQEIFGAVNRRRAGTGSDGE